MINDSALADSLDRQLTIQHPAFELVRDNQPFTIVSRTEQCEKCGTKIVAVRCPNWRTPMWCSLGDVYQAGPGTWRCRMTPHTPGRCADTARYYQPLDGALW